MLIGRKMSRFLKWTSGNMERWKIVEIGGGWKLVEIEGILGCLVIFMILEDVWVCLKDIWENLRKTEIKEI